MCAMIHSEQIKSIVRKSLSQNQFGNSQVHSIKRQYRLKQAVVPLQVPTGKLGRNYRPCSALLPCNIRYSEQKSSGSGADVPLQAVVPLYSCGSTAWSLKIKAARYYRPGTGLLPGNFLYSGRKSSGTTAVVPLHRFFKTGSGTTAPIKRQYRLVQKWVQRLVLKMPI